jgi:hypothetical protein
MLPEIAGRHTKKLILSLLSSDPSIFEKKLSYTLLKLQYRESPIDLYHREIEIFSDLIKSADYSANLNGKGRVYILFGSFLLCLMLGLCFY